MLPKNRRILRKEFTDITKNGKRHHSPSFILFLLPIRSKTGLNSKFSFSVSKKIHKKAVDRNKCRRIGYSVILRHLKQIKSGYYFFFSFKKTPKLISFATLEKEILELLSTLGMLI